MDIDMSGTAGERDGVATVFSADAEIGFDLAQVDWEGTHWVRRISGRRAYRRRSASCCRLVSRCGWHGDRI